ncbi:MAG: hypothetical protein J0H46_11230 [Bacteroidetes bacterium]|nr:hypothetical protein [Bacteroidota bacterium]
MNIYPGETTMIKNGMAFILMLCSLYTYGQKSESIYNSYFDSDVEHILSDTLAPQQVKQKNLDGYIIDYRYIFDSDVKLCTKYLFFFPGKIDVNDSLIDVFKRTVTGYVESNFVYDLIAGFKNNNTDSLQKLAVTEYHEVSDALDKTTGGYGSFYYKISHDEYIRVYKVNALIDVYYGSKLTAKRFNPLWDVHAISGDQMVPVFYACRKINSASFITYPIVFKAVLKKHNLLYPCD